ncbi:endonuclease/exonuclease/phosphatase family protein [Novosphingobium sp. BL-8A]|uniref:endonuclease/exonuclease/phosphatase family protein n=1 Tax=Novosphingobium sp. BL-8A TaxID=3127639 RepID=UPI003756703F
MARIHLVVTAVLGTLVIANVARPLPAAEFPAHFIPPAGPRSDLTVMTYNVKGLPFPAAFNRASALARIGENLEDLALTGHRPDVVALQEAFIPEAKAIAGQAGYKYLAIGPRQADAAPSPAMADHDRGASDLARKASWLKGETEGKWVDSGLVIMSDYPIVATRKMAFQQDLCAGFDCLASKGALIAWIRIPGQPQPVAVADTHLNARSASGVSVARANAAYGLQLSALRTFIARQVDRNTSLIFAGDFNVGHDPDRMAAARAEMVTAIGSSEATALAGLAQPGTETTSGDLAAIIKRGKDKQYFRAGMGQRLRYNGIGVPFGLASKASSLSDHLGYVVRYSLR